MEFKVGEAFSPEYFELERKYVWRQSWLLIGRIEDIPEPGDYFVKDIEVCKTSVLVTRGDDRQIRAFHNVCKHRSNKLVWKKETGQASRFFCSFHGWTFDLHGRLTVVPREELFRDFDKNDFPLTPIAIDTWEGFIFINLDPQPQETLRQFLGDIYDGYQGVFNGSKTNITYTVNLKTNWKASNDAFCENYHFFMVHRDTVGGVLISDENPYGDLKSIRLFEKHRAASATVNKSHKPKPVEALAYRYGPHFATPDDHQRNSQSGVNPDNLPDWGADLLFLYPAIGIFIFSDWFQVIAQWPIAHDQTRWELTTFARPPRTASEAFGQERNNMLLRELNREDLNNLEFIQSVLESGALRTFPLSEQESLVYHGEQVIANAVAIGENRL